MLANVFLLEDTGRIVSQILWGGKQPALAWRKRGTLFVPTGEIQVRFLLANDYRSPPQTDTLAYMFDC